MQFRRSGFGWITTMAENYTPIELHGHDPFDAQEELYIIVPEGVPLNVGLAKPDFHINDCPTDYCVIHNPWQKAIITTAIAQLYTQWGV